jgi:hypothetical protein
VGSVGIGIAHFEKLERPNRNSDVHQDENDQNKEENLDALAFHTGLE